MSLLCVDGRDDPTHQPANSQSLPLIPNARSYEGTQQHSASLGALGALESGRHEVSAKTGTPAMCGRARHRSAALAACLIVVECPVAWAVALFRCLKPAPFWRFYRSSTATSARRHNNGWPCWASAGSCAFTQSVGRLCRQQRVAELAFLRRDYHISWRRYAAP